MRFRRRTSALVSSSLAAFARTIGPECDRSGRERLRLCHCTVRLPQEAAPGARQVGKTTHPSKKIAEAGSNAIPCTNIIRISVCRDVFLCCCCLLTVRFACEGCWGLAPMELVPGVIYLRRKKR